MALAAGGRGCGGLAPDSVARGLWGLLPGRSRPAWCSSCGDLRVTNLRIGDRRSLRPPSGLPQRTRLLLYVDGRQRGVEQAPPFDFGTLHCGSEYGLTVIERGRGGPDRTLYATRYRAPACRGAVVVGTDGVPDVACNQTVGSGADLGTVLSDAAAGSTVCLSAGSWARQVISA